MSPCINQDCTMPTDNADGFCSFECWEKVNCGFPEPYVPEDDLCIAESST